jgi:hypothetical protein
MAIYKLFPSKDTTIYSLFPTMNTGLDEILESTTTTFGPNNTVSPQTSRFLIAFNQTEINSIINDRIAGANFDVYLNCLVSTVTGLTSTSSIVAHPLAKNWENGTGKYLDYPLTEDGASWIYSDYSGSTSWTTGIFASNTTASYNTSYSSIGGGLWYINGSEFNPIISSSQTFELYGSKDVSLNVSPAVKEWYSGSLPNYGFILKQPNSQEFINNSEYQVELKYFSRDTHTIYPPSLEFKWEDYSFDTGSSTSTILTSSLSYFSLQENPGTFNQNAVNRFRIYSRPKYPPRIYQTSSLYTTNYYLPESASFALKDLDTNEYVINFDNAYTRISADAESSYFDIYMNGLEPERYYKVLISCSLGGNQLIVDDGFYFKVNNEGTNFGYSGNQY